MMFLIEIDLMPQKRCFGPILAIDEYLKNVKR